MRLEGTPAAKAAAQHLRRSMSLPEVLLWRALRLRPRGLKFRRQHPAGPFILDFFCHDAALAVEVDGMGHDRGDRPGRDDARDLFLSRFGIETYRASARDVLNDLDAVVRGIVAAASARNPLHHASHGPPPPEGED